MNNAIYKTCVIIHVTATNRKDPNSDKTVKQISHHTAACYWDTGSLSVLHEDIFSSSPSQNRIVPTDIGTKPWSHSTCKYILLLTSPNQHSVGHNGISVTEDKGKNTKTTGAARNWATRPSCCIRRLCIQLHAGRLRAYS